MATSAFDLFKIGIGPSSSHTVGPMCAARRFVTDLDAGNLLRKVHRLEVELCGSLGATGRAHDTHKAIALGFTGDTPETVDVEQIDSRPTIIRERRKLRVLNLHDIDFDERRDLIFNPERQLPFHPNGMQFRAFADDAEEIHAQTFYSIGGGFVVDAETTTGDRITADNTQLEFPFTSAEQLLAHCEKSGLSISGIMLRNEQAWRSEVDVHAGLLQIWQVMQDCVKRGCANHGTLPGLKVKRRAAEMYTALSGPAEGALVDPLTIMDWVNLYALAVNEENAAGGRIVTAPINGAAGIVPAVLHYYARFCYGADDGGVVRFLLSAAAIGILFKENASISGAEVGCQGEVGSACSMAAGGLTEVLGGTPQQVENAAEIAMEHNLGLTCDPVGGLVQVPCIERNAMASVKAINAQRLAIRGDGNHFVSLDQVIQTMRDTGRDMQDKYKETARGGLATTVIPVPVSFIEC